MSGAGPTGISRREALKLAAGAALAHSLGGARRAVAAQGARAGFFSEAELALVDALTERIVPQDEHSPGAHEAGVAPFIDAMLARADPRYPEDAELIDSWRSGLEVVARVSRELHGGGFAEASVEQQTAVLERMASEERADGPEGRFFLLLKEWTVDVYYTSEIGIRQELGYLGNSVLEEFVGELPEGPARSG